ncbi:hypothetical protein F1B92_08600 [Campylobacter sp. FMV-PI01]|uniref:Uncharacterized protein n=2 Tax=Campylobacter portucalensis TaxID=2608384 RepID=A0A6L5WJK6_9BACT|nr:hypothetical protein [Campylobacter portucalensis]
MPNLRINRTNEMLNGKEELTLNSTKPESGWVLFKKVKPWFILPEVSGRYGAPPESTNAFYIDISGNSDWSGEGGYFDEKTGKFTNKIYQFLDTKDASQTGGMRDINRSGKRNRINW